MAILCFFAGTLFFFTLSPFSVFIPALAFFLQRKKRAFFFFLAAILYCSLHVWQEQEQGMPKEAVLPNVTLVGTILAIPTEQGSKRVFSFAIEKLNQRKVHAKALLTCYQNCPCFHAGEVWTLKAKLKRPRNLGNPGAFDFVRNLHARHLSFTGYIYADGAVLLQKTKNLASFREKLAKVFANTRLSKESVGIVEALTLGITTHMDSRLWELFRHTGTTHLMVISGSHIALVAIMVYSLCFAIWTRIPKLCLPIPALKAASVAAMLAAFSYTMLSGFGIPAQRAFLAFSLFLAPRFGKRIYSFWQGWRYALLLVLLFEPHAVLFSGFYLSFLAVAILGITSRYLQKGFKKAFALQLSCLIGLLPFTLYWFSYGAMNGFFANTVAIPLVGYLIVPYALIMLGLLSLFDCSFLLIPLQYLLEWFLLYLRFIDSFSFVNFTYTLENSTSLIALILAILSLFFSAHPTCYLAALLLLLSVWFPSHPTIPTGEARIDILDVGQGLSIVVRTKRHTLIYDTGMKFHQGSDMGQLAILPFLHSQGISLLDMVVISHPDLDHRGGLPSLQAHIPIKSLLGNEAHLSTQNCHTYPSWQWDQVLFRFLPIQTPFAKGNNRSCVLQIEAQDQRILLTGDIEKEAESYLQYHYASLLASSYLVLAHHGSSTSTSLAFLQAVSPQYALISAGFDNRFHFPHAKTLHTLEQQGIPMLQTMDCGMISIFLQKKTVQCYLSQNTKVAKVSA